MKKYLTILSSIVFILCNSCSNGQTPISKLTPTEFAGKIKALPSATIIDVRTPEEYAKGHLTNSLNYDWNGNNFDKQIAPLDKTKPVFVYCLSGGRSGAAAAKMRTDGFETVYEMDGGMMKWRAANMPETTNNATANNGITRKQFDALLNSDKMVLVDFYADWCAPCKLMKPYLEEISKEMANKVVVVRINTDDNQTIIKELKIDALPVLQLYKNKTLTWTNSGYIEKAEVVKHLQ